MLGAVGANLYLNKSYITKTRALGSQLPPESRLVLCCAGGIALPVGLMTFAFTATPSVHWIGSTIAGALFGFGFVGIFLSMTVCIIFFHLPEFLRLSRSYFPVLPPGYLHAVCSVIACMYRLYQVFCWCWIPALHPTTTCRNEYTSKPPLFSDYLRALTRASTFFSTARSGPSFSTPRLPSWPPQSRLCSCDMGRTSDPDPNSLPKIRRQMAVRYNTCKLERSSSHVRQACRSCAKGCCNYLEPPAWQRISQRIDSILET
jgi:hypothetical protein